MWTEIYNRLFVDKAAAWTAAFTGVLVLFTYLLYCVSSQSNEASLASQRAFLSNAISPRLESVVIGGKVASYKVHEVWANNGTTPTLTAISQFNVASGADRPFHGFDFGQLPQAQRQEYVLGPKATWEVLPVPLSFEALAGATTGRHVFAWGWVVYRDIYQGTRVRLSEFCFELTNPQWGGTDPTDPASGPTVQTPPCQTHNCYDERCEDYAKLSQEIK